MTNPHARLTAPVTGEDLAQRLRRRAFLRAMGHTPTAPNCRFAQAWDFLLPKTVCEACQRITRRWPHL